MNKKVLAIAAAIALIAVIAVVSLRDDSKPEVKPHALTTSATAVVSVDDQPSGAVLPNNALGLSLEASELARPQLAGGNLAKYLKTMGTGTIRIGGNQVDETFWTSSNEDAPSWASATITPDDLMHLNEVAQNSGWKVMLGVNFKHYDPARAGDEAQQAQKILGGNLASIAIGNEPSMYYSSTSDFINNFNTYATQIRQSAPGVTIVGADTQHSSAQEKLSSAFAGDQQNSPTVSSLTEHHYPTTTCGSRSSSIDDLLSSSTYRSSKIAFDGIVQRAKEANLPPILTETNSVSCEGQEGVSDTFASSLWALDYALNAAQEGLKGVYFHGSLTQCNSSQPAFKYYSPQCAATKSDYDHGNVKGQPEYYGLLAFSKMGSGNFLHMNNAAFPNLRAYAVKQSDGSIRIALINLESNPSYSATNITVTVPAGYTSVQQSTLQTTAKDTLSSKTNVELSEASSDKVSITGQNVDVTIPNAGAAILTIS